MKVSILPRPQFSSTMIYVYTNKGQWYCQYADNIDLSAAQKIAAEAFEDEEPQDDINWAAF